MSGQDSKMPAMCFSACSPWASLAGRVVLEHHVRRVHRPDPLDIVVVPGVVVGVDRLAQLVARVGHAQSMGWNPLDRGAETMSTLAISSPPLLTVRV